MPLFICFNGQHAAEQSAETGPLGSSAELAKSSVPVSTVVTTNYRSQFEKEHLDVLWTTLFRPPVDDLCELEVQALNS